MPVSLTLLCTLAVLTPAAQAPIVDEAPAAVISEPALEPVVSVPASETALTTTETATTESATTATTATATTATDTTATTTATEPTAKTATALTTTTTTTTTKADDPFAPGTIGNHLAWYGAEYAAVAAVGAVYLTGVYKLVPPGPALIGPRFDVQRPDLDVLFDPRLDSSIGRPFLREQVSNGALTIGLFSALAATSLLDLAIARDLQHTHSILLGGAETLAGTVLIVEVLKPLFGRLRPDFRDRYVHAACGGTVDVPDGLDCSTVDQSFTIDADDLRDGSKSFVSGHAATSFAMATFASWWLGSSLVWADDAPVWGPAVGALGIGGVMTAAGWVSATRLNDNRHNIEDVVVGAGIGATVATTLFLTHFDWRGQVRQRSFTVSPALAMGSTGTGTGLAIAGALP